MNSFNHYAYASVADWVYGVACGIRPLSPGFARARIAPCPDPRVQSLGAVLDTVHGRIRSGWKYVDGTVRYEVETPVPTELVIDGKSRWLEAGSYIL